MWNSLLQTYADGMKEFTQTISSDVKEQINARKSNEQDSKQQPRSSPSTTTTHHTQSHSDPEIDDMFAEFETPISPSKAFSTSSGPPSALSSNKTPSSSHTKIVNKSPNLYNTDNTSDTKHTSATYTPRSKRVGLSTKSALAASSTPRTLKLTAQQKEAIRKQNTQQQKPTTTETEQQQQQQQSGKSGFWADIQTAASSTLTALTSVTTSSETSKHTTTSSSPFTRVASTDSSSSTTAPYSRKQSRLDQIREDPATFVNEPVNVGLFNEWNQSFSVDTKTEEIATLLSQSVALKNLHTKFVPAVVTYALFWERYFFQVHLIEQEEAKREKLLKESQLEDDEDDFAWGSDQEDEQDTVHETIEPETVTVQQDTVTIEQDPVTVQQDTVTIEQDPVTVQQNTVAIQQDPVTIDQDTVTVKQDTEEDEWEETFVFQDDVQPPKPTLLSPRLSALQNNNGTNQYLTPTKTNETTVPKNSAVRDEETTPEWKAPVLVGTTPNTPDMMDSSWEQEEDDEAEQAQIISHIPKTPLNKDELLKKIINDDDDEDEDDWGW
eukprot:TRINITY_DN2405_c0_g1_i3.p1 TRINITY_DN2405_c0_g1~~TRINITY_DN2405_c0_g1_i3.p1  ORF type:complete len:562 (+),score=177.83 TRINITY_DN2405_c0_g1_i3:35-1687(+)